MDEKELESMCLEYATTTKKTNQKKKKMTQYFKQGDVSNVWHELTN